MYIPSFYTSFLCNILSSFSADNSKFSNEFGTVRKSFSRTYGPLLHFRFRSSSIGDPSSPSSLLKLECCIPTAICRQDSGLNRIQFFESGINPFALLRSHLQQLRHNSMVTVLMLRSGRFAGAGSHFNLHMSLYNNHHHLCYV